MNLKFYSYEKAVFGKGPGKGNIIKESNPDAMFRLLVRGDVTLDGKGEENVYFRSVKYPNVRYFTKEIALRQ